MFSGCSPILLASLGQYGDPSMRVCFQALTTISNECALVPCGLGGVTSCLGRAFVWQLIEVVKGGLSMFKPCTGASLHQRRRLLRSFSFEAFTCSRRHFLLSSCLSFTRLHGI